MSDAWIGIAIKLVGTFTFAFISWMGFEAGRARASSPNPPTYSRREKRLIAIATFAWAGMVLGTIWLVPITHEHGYIPRTDSVKGYFTKMRADMDRVKATIATDAAGIDSAVTSLQSQVLAQSLQLDVMNQRVIEARREAEQYRALASLSRQQQDAFLKALDQRATPTWLSFLLGFVSSALVTIFASIIGRRFGKRTTLTG